MPLALFCLDSAHPTYLETICVLLHPTLVSLCTHESLSNLSCEGRSYNPTAGPSEAAQIKSKIYNVLNIIKLDSPPPGLGTRLPEVCTTQI